MTSLSLTFSCYKTYFYTKNNNNKHCFKLHYEKLNILSPSTKLKNEKKINLIKERFLFLKINQFLFN